MGQAVTVKMLNDAHRAQIEKMHKEDGKKVPEIIEFFSSTYQIDLRPGDLYYFLAKKKPKAKKPRPEKETAIPHNVGQEKGCEDETIEQLTASIVSEIGQVYESFRKVLLKLRGELLHVKHQLRGGDER